jgi:hypothetical protein
MTFTIRRKSAGGVYPYQVYTPDMDTKGTVPGGFALTDAEQANTVCSLLNAAYQEGRDYEVLRQSCSF